MEIGKCIESILVYGISNAGKTTQAQELAKFIYKNSGKLTRLVSMSGGGWTSIQPAIDAGIVVPTYIRSRSHPVETLKKMCEGFWPADPADPTSPLLPIEKQEDWSKIGGIVYDGITEGCTWMMSYITNAEAAGEFKISAQPMKFKDGETNFGSPSMAHYGNVQQRIDDFVSSSKGIRGVYIMWTALELKASEDNTRLPLYGPDVSGKAKTAIASAWFDNTLHLYMTGQGGLKKSNTKVERRLYLTTHFEDDGIPYIAKNRGHFYAPLPDFLAGSECSVAVFLEKLQNSHKLAGERLRKELGV